MTRLPAIPIAATALLALALAMQTTSAQPLLLQQSIYRQPESAIAPPSSRVTDLVRVLSDESFKKRDRAVRSLFEMGQPILPELRQELERIDAGIPKDERSSLTDHIPQPYPAFHELRVVVDRLEERRKSAGSIITLKFDDAPLIDALRELARQAEWDLTVFAIDQATMEQLTAGNLALPGMADFIIDSRWRVDPFSNHVVSPPDRSHLFRCCGSGGMDGLPPCLYGRSDGGRNGHILFYK